MARPRIELTTYGDGSPAVIVHVPGEPGGYPIEDIGGAEVLRRYRAVGDLSAIRRRAAEFRSRADDATRRCGAARTQEWSDMAAGWRELADAWEALAATAGT